MQIILTILRVIVDKNADLGYNISVITNHGGEYGYYNTGKYKKQVYFVKKMVGNSSILVD